MRKEQQMGTLCQHLMCTSFYGSPRQSVRPLSLNRSSPQRRSEERGKSSIQPERALRLACTRLVASWSLCYFSWRARGDRIHGRKYGARRPHIEQWTNWTAQRRRVFEDFDRACLLIVCTCMDQWRQNALPSAFCINL